VLSDLFAIASFQDELPWQPFREGIEIYSLGQPGEGGAEPRSHTALLRYQPGATVPQHSHPGREQILVLAGAQQDDRGTYPAGTLVINPPGSRHRVASPQGCIVLITWEQPVIIEADP
jgi:anti-sigma factor ChrR (cupin superfamily)